MKIAIAVFTDGNDMYEFTFVFWHTDIDQSRLVFLDWVADGKVLTFAEELEKISRKTGYKMVSLDIIEK